MLLYRLLVRNDYEQKINYEQPQGQICFTEFHINTSFCTNFICKKSQTRKTCMEKRGRCFMQPNLINTVNKYDQLEHCSWLLFQTIVPAKKLHKSLTQVILVIVQYRDFLVKTNKLHIKIIEQEIKKKKKQSHNIN